MSRSTIDFGIDLGTTNSAIAVWDGSSSKVIKNNENNDCTPSAIYIDKESQMRVGRQAKERVETEPDDAYCEFKLQMGTPTEYIFKKSNRRMKPEELSSEVLKSLRADVKRRLNEDLGAAVITVPAAFDLPACDATRRAAEMAGFAQNYLIMEPTAAAMAYALGKDGLDKGRKFWLVYDFGGGTFDAAVIQIKDEDFKIVGHSGDNHLGGKLIDWAIVDEILAPQFVKDSGLRDFNRGNLKYRRAFAKLKNAAEKAKLLLSVDESAEIDIEMLFSDDQNQYPFQYILKRPQIARIAIPFVKRSVNIAQKALIEAKLGTADIDRVILVGGPTQSPYFRDQLADRNEGLGIPLDFSVDPLTVVAQGAAICAGTFEIRPGGGSPPPPPTTGNYTLELKGYSPQGSDPEPPIGGVIAANEEGKDFSGYTLSLTNTTAKPAWKSGKIKLSARGTFTTNLWVDPHKRSEFLVELFDPTGTMLPIKPNTIQYTHATEIPKPVMVHSIGVRLQSGEMEWFLEKGRELPAKGLKNLKTPKDLSPKRPSEHVRVEVREGEHKQADCNERIGSLNIYGRDIPRDLPVNSELEIKLIVDDSRGVKVEVYVPMLDRLFEAEMKLEKELADIGELESQFKEARGRLSDVKSQSESGSVREIVKKIEEEDMIDNVQKALAAAKSGDKDAQDKAEKRLIDFRVALNSAEEKLKWPKLVEELKQFGQESRGLVVELERAASDDPSIPIGQIKPALINALNKLDEAIQKEDEDLALNLKEEISKMIGPILIMIPAFVVGWFQQLSGQTDEMTDRQKARQLVQMGNNALVTGDIQTLRSIVIQLMSLLPGGPGPGDDPTTNFVKK